MRVTVYDPCEFSAAAAAFVAARVGDAVADRGECSLALAGGSTPRPVYRRMADIGAVPWRRVSVFFGDERAVPPDHAESNYRMARESLLRRVPVDPARVFPMEAEREDLEAAARAYEELLPRSLDVLLLGIGEDGHTASLFPGSDALAERHRRVVPTRGPARPHRRLTITPPVIRDARRPVVLATGSRKAEPVRRALEAASDPEECPARLARDGDWLLDREASEALER